LINLFSVILYELGKGMTSRWHPYVVNLSQRYNVLVMFGKFEKLFIHVDFYDFSSQKLLV